MKIIVDKLPDIGDHCVFYKDEVCPLGDDVRPKCWNDDEIDTTNVHLCPYLIDINSLDGDQQ